MKDFGFLIDDFFFGDYIFAWWNIWVFIILFCLTIVFIVNGKATLCDTPPCSLIKWRDERVACLRNFPSVLFPLSQAPLFWECLHFTPTLCSCIGSFFYLASNVLHKRHDILHRREAWLSKIIKAFVQMRRERRK